MQRGYLAGLLVPLIAALVAPTGCATTHRAAYTETPGMAVRVPLVASPDVSLRAEEPKRPPYEPAAVADEYRHRWLRLFEIDFLPPPVEPRTDAGGPIALPPAPPAP